MWLCTAGSGTVKFYAEEEVSEAYFADNLDVGSLYSIYN